MCTNKCFRIQFGCTVPYLPQLGSEPVCDEAETAIAAADLYLIMTSSGHRKICQRPCAAFAMFTGEFVHKMENIKNMRGMGFLIHCPF